MPDNLSNMSVFAQQQKQQSPAAHERVALALQNMNLFFHDVADIERDMQSSLAQCRKRLSESLNGKLVAKAKSVGAKHEQQQQQHNNHHSKFYLPAAQDVNRNRLLPRTGGAGQQQQHNNNSSIVSSHADPTAATPSHLTTTSKATRSWLAKHGETPIQPGDVVITSSATGQKIVLHKTEDDEFSRSLKKIRAEVKRHQQRQQVHRQNLQLQGLVTSAAAARTTAKTPSQGGASSNQPNAPSQTQQNTAVVQTSSTTNARSIFQRLENDASRRHTLQQEIITTRSAYRTPKPGGSSAPQGQLHQETSSTSRNVAQQLSFGATPQQRHQQQQPSSSQQQQQQQTSSTVAAHSQSNRASRQQPQQRRGTTTAASSSNRAPPTTTSTTAASHRQPAPVWDRLNQQSAQQFTLDVDALIDAEMAARQSKHVRRSTR